MIKKQILNLFLVFFLVLASSLMANDENLFSEILTQNQKINEFMLKSKKEIPDVKALDSALDEYIKSGKKNKSKVEELRGFIQKPSSNFEEFKNNYSEFSRGLSKIMKQYKVSKNHNRFFCPMTKGHWVSEGKKVNNPYSPKMRNCGSLKKT